MVILQSVCRSVQGSVLGNPVCVCCNQLAPTVADRPPCATPNWTRWGQVQSSGVKALPDIEIRSVQAGLTRAYVDGKFTAVSSTGVLALVLTQRFPRTELGVNRVRQDSILLISPRD